MSRLLPEVVRRNRLVKFGVAICLVIALITAVGVLTYVQTMSELETNTQDDYTAMSQQGATELTAWQRERASALTVITADSVDEIGRLYGAFDAMRESLRQRIEEAETQRADAETQRADTLDGAADQTHDLATQADRLTELTNNFTVGSHTEAETGDATDQSREPTPDHRSTPDHDNAPTVPDSTESVSNGHRTGELRSETDGGEL